MKILLVSSFLCVLVAAPCLAQNEPAYGSTIVWPDLNSWIQYWQAFQNYISSHIPTLNSLTNSNNSGCKQHLDGANSTNTTTSSVSSIPETTSGSPSKVKTKTRPPAKNSRKGVKKHNFHAKYKEHDKNRRQEKHHNLS